MILKAVVIILIVIAGGFVLLVLLGMLLKETELQPKMTTLAREPIGLARLWLQPQRSPPHPVTPAHRVEAAGVTVAAVRIAAVRVQAAPTKPTLIRSGSAR